MTPIPWLVALGFSLALSRIDIREHRLPNRLVAAMVLLVSAAIVVFAPDPVRPAVTTSLVTGLKYAAVHVVVFIASRGQFGMGDVKFALPLGLVVGFYSPTLWLVAVMASFAAAAAVSIVLVAAGRLSLRSRIPFGPYMAVAALAVSLPALIG